MLAYIADHQDFWKDRVAPFGLVVASNLSSTPNSNSTIALSGQDHVENFVRELAGKWQPQTRS